MEALSLNSFCSWTNELTEIWQVSEIKREKVTTMNCICYHSAIEFGIYYACSVFNHCPVHCLPSRASLTYQWTICMQSLLCWNGSGNTLLAGNVQSSYRLMQEELKGLYLKLCNTTNIPVRQWTIILYTFSHIIQCTFARYTYPLSALEYMCII